MKTREHLNAVFSRAKREQIIYDFNIQLEEEKEQYIQENQGQISAFGRSYSLIDDVGENSRDTFSRQPSISFGAGALSAEDANRRANELTEQMFGVSFSSNPRIRDTQYTQ